MKRRGMALLYVGDVGVLREKYPTVPVPDDIDLESMTFREMFNLCVAAGIRVQDLIGVQTCLDHYGPGFSMLGAKKLPDGYCLADDCCYCQNCYQTFVRKRSKR